MREHCNRTNTRGVTLLELMAVVCIFIVLMTVLTSGMKSAYKKIESVQCSNNLKNIGLAIQLYVGDNDYLLPTPGRSGGDTWARKLLKGEYVSEGKIGIFSCPAMPAPRTYRINSGHNSGSEWEHADELEGGPFDYSSLEKPSQTLLLSEYQNTSMTTDIDTSGSEVYTDNTRWNGNYPVQQYDALLSVHNGGSNYLFFDYHVEWIEREEMKDDPNDYTFYNKP